MVGCVTKAPQPDSVDFQSARWKTEVQITDLKSQKEQALKIVIIAERGRRARLEATALLGYPVASIVIDSEELKAAIHPRKQFYTGPVQSNMLERVLRVGLTGSELLSLLFDEPLQSKNWKCQIDQQKKPSECQSVRSGTLIRWTSQSDGNKKVVIQSSRIKAEWDFETPQTNVEVKEALFQLEPPSGYKSIQIN